MTKHEPLVPLAELGLDRMSGAELAAYAHLADVEIRLDYLDRPSVTLEAAYKIAESRRRAEREYADAEVARRTEHARAVKDLQERVNAAFVEARTARLAANVGANLWGGQVERDGLATNEGLEAARMIWAAAPAHARDEVQVVEYEDAGVITSVPLSLAMPLDLISDYAHAAARLRNR